MIAQSRAIPVILTRPAEQGARFAKELRDRFGATVDMIQSPLLAPQFLQPVIGSGPWTAVIFTSATAVSAFGLLGSVAEALPKMAYCVGDQTAKAARAKGFHAISAKGDASALCAVIRDAHETGPLIHLRGEEAQGDIATVLTLAGIETQQAVVYREVAQPLSADARAILSSDSSVILPVFSPRTGTILAQELTALRHFASPIVVAISPAVANTLDMIDATRRIVASRPDRQSMLAAIGQALKAAQAA